EKIIYPTGLDKEAAEVEYLVNLLNDSTRSTIGGRKRPVNIVFHNQTTIANAYVQLAPFRSEFQLTPLQNSFDLGSLPWHQTLAIHEYRHVQQYNNFRVGLSKVFFYLFGEEGLALANNLSVPNWFWEGDAVYQETLVSRQGRGRLPLFLSSYQSLWLAGKNYSWMKLRNGSLRDYTPDHYPLGYMLVAYGREKYGNDFWGKTAVEAAAFKGFFYPLQHATKAQTGIDYRRFRQQALEFFHTQIPDTAYKESNAVYARSQAHFNADQAFPQFIDSDRLVFLRSSYRRPPVFVERSLSDQQEKKIGFRAVSLDDQFSYRNGKIIYSAYEPDLRWGWRDYSVIRILDLHTRKDIRLTSRTKYFSPDISPDDSMVVAVDYSSSAHCFLDILDAHSGRRLYRLPNPENLFFTYPKFYGEGQLISAVRNGRGEMCLMSIAIPSGKQELLLSWSMAPIGFVSVSSGNIYFTRTTNGRDRGFVLKNGNAYALDTSPLTGAYQLAARFGKLAWTNFTAAGYHLNLADSSLFSTDPYRFDDLQSLPDHRVLSLNHPPVQLPDSISAPPYAVKRYPNTEGLFHFHSWRPYIDDPDYSFALVSENMLNTFQSQVYIGYNRNEQYKSVGADFNYGGWFPQLDAGVEYLIDRNAYFSSRTKLYWNELQPYIGLFVPLNLSRGRWLTSLQPGASFTYHEDYFRGPYKDSIRFSGYGSLDPYISFSHQLQAGKQQIYPSFAQTVLIRYDRAVTNIAGEQFLASGNFYLPGLTSTHSLELRAAFQQR
ncbi:MAG TPA: hypothetical protein VG890_08315, partial [Puia sp.]|nr:hypothetical protein [Puia sp.]